MMKASYIVCLAFLICCFNGFSQDISTSTITWTVNHGFDLKSNSDFNYQGSFTTNGSNSITWSQGSGNFISTFTISSLQGTWTDVSTNGTVTYQVEQDGSSGTLKFERTSEGIFVTLDFPSGDSQGSWLKFQVSSLSQAN